MRTEDALVDAGTRVLDLGRNPTQRAFFLDTTKHLCYSGGFGSGKTSVCCLKGLTLSSGIANNMGVVCRRSYPDLRDSTRKSFIELTPPDWIKYWREAENAMTLKNGSVILFRYFDNGKVKVGPNLGWFFLDQAEEASKEVFLALLGRLRRFVPRLCAMLAMNPNGRDWQHKMFVENSKPDFKMYESTSFDNKDNLPPGYIETMMAEYPKEWVERFVFGKWTAMSGLIFHEFDRRRHVVDPFTIPRDWYKARGLDWGVDALTTCAYIAVAPDGTRYVFDCYGDREKTAAEHAKAILKQGARHAPYRVSVLDDSAFHRDKDLKSVADEYSKAGLTVQRGTKDLLASVMHVKQLLKDGKLLFFRGENVEPALAEMEAWKWGPRRNGHEIPANGSDHYIDSIRYVCYLLHRRGLYRAPGGAVEGVGERVGGKLTIGQRAEACDSVTGLPA